MAAFEWHVGTFLIGAPGPQPITGVGFQPKAVILYHGDDDNLLLTSSPGQTGGIGFADDSGNNVAMAWTSGASAIEAQTVGESLSNCFVSLVTIFPGATFPQGTSNITSMDPDGFTINNNLFGAPTEVYYIAIGGDTMSAQCGNILCDNTAADDVVALGFTPTIGFFMQGAPGQDVEPSMILGKHYSFGVTNNTENYSNCVWRAGLGTALNNRGHNESTTHPIHQRNPDGSIFMEALAQLNANELRIVKNIIPASDSNLLYLVLNDTGSKIGNFDAVEGAGAALPVTGVGFTPIGQMYMSDYSDGLPANDATNSFSFGAQEGINPPGSGEAYSLSWLGDDNYPGTSIFDRTSSTDDAFISGDLAGTVRERFFTESLDPDGFTIRNVAPKAFSNLVHYVMLGEPLPPPPTGSCGPGNRCVSNFKFLVGEYGVCGTPEHPGLWCIGNGCEQISDVPTTFQCTDVDLGPDYMTDFEIADYLAIRGLRNFLELENTIAVIVRASDDPAFGAFDEEVFIVNILDLTGFGWQDWFTQLDFSTMRRYWRICIGTTVDMNRPLISIAMGKAIELERSPVAPVRTAVLDEFIEAQRFPLEWRFDYQGVVASHKQRLDERLFQFADVAPVWLIDEDDSILYGNEIAKTFLTLENAEMTVQNEYEIELRFEEVPIAGPPLVEDDDPNP